MDARGSGSAICWARPSNPSFGRATPSRSLAATRPSDGAAWWPLGRSDRSERQRSTGARLVRTSSAAVPTRRAGAAERETPGQGWSSEIARTLRAQNQSLPQVVDDSDESCLCVDREGRERNQTGSGEPQNIRRPAVTQAAILGPGPGANGGTRRGPLPVRRSQLPT